MGDSEPRKVLLTDTEESSFMAMGCDERLALIVNLLREGAHDKAFAFSKLDSRIHGLILNFLSKPDNKTELDQTLKQLLQRANSNLVTAVLDVLDVQKSDTVLEIGFGTGDGIVACAKSGPQKIVGLEYSPAMVDDAREGALKNLIAEGIVELQLGSILTSGMADQQFHKIYHLNCFYFWPDLKTGVQECYRILKPEGIMVTGAKPGPVKAITGEEGEFDSETVFKNRDVDRYVELLKEVGFVDVTLEHHDGEAGGELTEYTLICSRKP